MSNRFLLTLLISGRLVVCAFSAESPAFALPRVVHCHSPGIFLTDVFKSAAVQDLPRLRLADAPAFGQAAILTKSQILLALQSVYPDLPASHLNGPAQIHAVRAARTLGEAEVKERLTALLQESHARDRGQLELRLTRPWAGIHVPDEDFSLRILDLPSTGVSPYFIVRFEVRNGDESIGTHQVPLQAKIWREIWVARSIVRRGMILNDADVVRERRDVLGLRESPLALESLDASYEIAENLIAGSPLLERSVQLRPVMRRGQLVEAQLHEGIMTISLKVELLEDGAPGQLVRVRNVKSKREFRGKVLNESTILVLL